MSAAMVEAGQIAHQHLACLTETAGIEVAAVCDLSPAVAESAAERFAIPPWFTDHRAMLERIRPDVVHSTTPPTSHFKLAIDALEAGAHVILEKPATVTLAELELLAGRARELQRALIEDYNYVFNRAPQEILRRIESGEFGPVVHVDVLICLDILGSGGGFADANAPHPCLSLAGGAIADFLPHLASLAHLFVGRHRRVSSSWVKRKPSTLPYDEFHAIVEAERGTASLGFSASSRLDGFWLRVYGERMQAAANLFEKRLTFDSVRGGPKPLQPLRSGLKFGAGPGAYEGLWDLVRRTYRALGDGGALPVPEQQLLEVNRLVAALRPEGGRP
jgi:predicted dehydrogenase